MIQFKYLPFRSGRCSLLLAGALAMSFPFALAGQEEHSEATASGQTRVTESGPVVATPQGIETAEEESEHEEFTRHNFAAFLGGSTHKSENGFTLGGEYEYRFHRMVGVGFQAEHIWGDLRESAFIFPISFHPGAGLILTTGPGFDQPDSGGEDAPEKEGGREGTAFLYRVQIQYEFEINERVKIIPNVSLDFVNSQRVWVYGVSLGYGF